MFTGLSAFPITPVNASGIDEDAFLRLLGRLTRANVDSLGVLGSTGSYAWFTREQRRRITELAVAHAEGIPVMVSIGAFSTDAILRLAEDAQQAGASALLLPALAYQGLTQEEVYGLYHDVAHAVSRPICVYDNPRTTHTQFSDALYARIATLPNIASFKIPGVPEALPAAQQRIATLREQLPAHIRLGISGDQFAATALQAGCDLWYSVCAGLFPHTAKALYEAAKGNGAQSADEQAQRLEPLWALYRKHNGSLRVMAAAAHVLGDADAVCLPRPLRMLTDADTADVRRVITELGLT